MRISDWSSDVCSSDLFADEAIEAIEANRNRPFFLYLAFNAPHTPLQATKADYDKLPQIKDHKTRVYGAMIAQLDRRIGDVMAKLKEAGIDDNTLVKIGRAHVCTPVTKAHLVCRLSLEKNKTT